MRAARGGAAPVEDPRGASDPGGATPAAAEASEPDPRRLGATSILRLAVWFGLVAGLLEATMRGAQILLGDRIFLGPDVVWMAPLADAALFVAVALLLYAASFGVPLLRRIGVVASILAFLTLAGPLLAYPRLHAWAGVLLAAGIGAQSGRLLGRRPGAVSRIVRRTVPWLVACVVALGLLVRGAAWIQERRALAALPEPEEGAPSVLLLILDTVRSDHLSVYGYGHPTTPTLEHLAREAVLFEHAFSPSPWTLPAHASMFTGRYPHQLSAGWLTPLGDEVPTLPERFARRGYRTAGFVGNLIYATWETGLQRGFSRYEDYPLSVAMVANSSWLVRGLVKRARSALGAEGFLVRKPAEEINAAFLRWLGRDERPFFAFLNYMDAHAPYLPPEPFDGRFGPRRKGSALADLSQRRQWLETDLRAERAAYDGEIAHMDAQIGALLDSLDARGLSDRTLLVVTSDHGEQFGEHGLTDHGNSLYRPLLEVPLLLRYPERIPAGRRVETPVSLRDLATTVLELTGDSAAGFPGRSLTSTWKKAGEPKEDGPSPLLGHVGEGVRMPEWMPIMRGDMYSLSTAGHHYILNGDGSEELYDLADDRREGRNLAGSGQGPGVGRFREALSRLIGRPRIR